MHYRDKPVTVFDIAEISNGYTIGFSSFSFCNHTISFFSLRPEGRLDGTGAVAKKEKGRTESDPEETIDDGRMKCRVIHTHLIS